MIRKRCNNQVRDGQSIVRHEPYSVQTSARVLPGRFLYGPFRARIFSSFLFARRVLILIVKGREAIADVFGVSVKTIHEWHDQGLPIASRGSPGKPSEYDTLACITWLVDREVSKVMSERPRDRLARVQADKIERENTERRRVLIPADQIEPKLRAALVDARNLWGDSPQRLARDIHGKSTKEAEDMLLVAFDGFLLEMARWPMRQHANVEQTNGTD